MTAELARQLQDSVGVNDGKPPTRRRRRLVPPIAGPGRPDKYVLASGKRVPSVTTITGRFKNAGGLLKWAHAEGAAGRTLDQKRDEAADAGLLAHQWIEDTIHGRTITEFGFIDERQIAQAERALEAFLAWSRQVSLAVVETEVPLVSERLELGGTPDMVAYVDGILTLVDWKTGNRIYNEHIVQMAAYRQMLRERDGARRAPREGLALRLDKDSGQPHARIFMPETLDLAWEYFRRARQMYRIDQDLAKIVGTNKEHST